MRSFNVWRHWSDARDDDGPVGCGNMSQRDKNTAIGAGVGGAAGAVLTGGGTAGTLGGAAIGGVIGNQVGK